MPTNKDLKRLVRARMSKTGESYTAARAQLARKSAKLAPSTKPLAGSAAELSADATAPASSRPAQPGPTAQAALHADPSTYAKLAGMSDAVVEEKTGCTWEHWVYVLDKRGAATMTHREIADVIKTKYKVGPWWTQMVVVGYERIKGLRTERQKRNGTFEASKSRTFNVPVETLFEAWADAGTRRKWLDAAGVKVRRATAPKSLRLDWPAGGIVVIGFVSKGKGKSAVAVSQDKLADRDAVTRVKDYWTTQLDSLAAMFAAGQGGG